MSILLNFLLAGAVFFLLLKLHLLQKIVRLQGEAFQKQREEAAKKEAGLAEELADLKASMADRLCTIHLYGQLADEEAETLALKEKCRIVVSECEELAKLCSHN